MQIENLGIDGAYLVTPILRGDDRGHFAETFRADVFAAATGHDFRLAQANTSRSARHVVRGVHFALVPPGQAKYVQCLVGSILDIAVDIRVGSPTFGQHVAVELDDRDRRALYVAEGLGHAFCALSEHATVHYLCSTGYNPEREFAINPLDPALDLDWPTDRPIVSERDAAAPTLAQAQEHGQLPDYAACTAYVDSLRH